MTLAGTRVAAPKPKPLGGWVVWFGVWLVVVSLSQLRVVWGAFTKLDMILAAPIAQQLGIAFSVVGNCLLFAIAPVWLLILMTDRDRRFPIQYVAWCVAVPVFLALDSAVAYTIYYDLYQDGRMQLWSRGAITAAIGSIAGLIVWSTYMLRSTHVRDTFTAGGKRQS